MSVANRLKQWITGEGKDTEDFGPSTNGTKFVRSESVTSPSLAFLFGQMASDVAVSMLEAQADLKNRVEQTCSTEPLCLICRAKALGDSLSAPCVGGSGLERYTDGEQ